MRARRGLREIGQDWSQQLELRLGIVTRTGGCGKAALWLASPSKAWHANYDASYLQARLFFQLRNRIALRA